MIFCKTEFGVYANSLVSNQAGNATYESPITTSSSSCGCILNFVVFISYGQPTPIGVFIVADATTIQAVVPENSATYCSTCTTVVSSNTVWIYTLDIALLA